MNKKFLTFTIILLFNFCINVEVGETIKLPDPDKEGGIPLYKAFNTRKSSRDFDETKDISLTTLSQALWSCYEFGVSTSRTVPSAKAWYPFLIYLFLKDGVYLHNPDTHEITKILDGDHREVTGEQTSVITKAAVNFVFIGDLRKETIIEEKIRRLACSYDIGHLTQVLSLFAAANDMKGLVRAGLNENIILDFLELDKTYYYVPIAFSLGY